MFYFYTPDKWEELTFGDFKRTFYKHLLLTSDELINEFVDAFWHDVAINKALNYI